MVGPSSLSRMGLIYAVFSACDADGDGLLRKQELRRFAEQTGFCGNDAEWNEAYELLCSENGISDPALGVDARLLFRLVDNEDNRCFCSNGDLRRILERLELEVEEQERYCNNGHVMQRTQLKFLQGRVRRRRCEQCGQAIQRAEPRLQCTSPRCRHSLCRHCDQRALNVSRSVQLGKMSTSTEAKVGGSMELRRWRCCLGWKRASKPFDAFESRLCWGKVCLQRSPSAAISLVGVSH